MNYSELAKYIDHTNLKPDAGEQVIEGLCEEALQFGFTSVCVAPLWVPLAYRKLKERETVVCTVIGFPLGYSTPLTKAREAAEAVACGAKEIDMVIPVGLLKMGNVSAVAEDISAVVEYSKRENSEALVKVIIECCYLVNEEKEQACRIAFESGADFVKTSTGFGPSGATVEDVRLMRRVVGDRMGVKAAGGIRTYEDAIAMIGAGANRIGTSNGVAIVKGA